MTVRLRPVACFANPPLAEIDDACVVAVKNIVLDAAPKRWPDSGVVLFEVTKTEHLMTPSAHFYGRKAHGYLLRHEPGDIVACTAGDIRRGDWSSGGTAGLLLALCRADGQPLPETSEYFYPRVYQGGRLPIAVSVDHAAFHAIETGTRVYFGPSPDHPDRHVPTTGPPSTGVEPGHLHLDVLKKTPAGAWWRIEFADGTVAQATTRREFVEIKVGQHAFHHDGRAARTMNPNDAPVVSRVVSKRCVRTPALLHGTTIAPMTVLTPLSVDVGRHVAPKRMPMGKPGAGRVFRVRCSGDVRTGDTFMIKKRRCEILEQTPEGAVVLELLPQPKSGSIFVVDPDHG